MSQPTSDLPEMGQPEFAQHDRGRWVPPWWCGCAYLASIQAWTGLRMWRDFGDLPICSRWRWHRGLHIDADLGAL